jgi:hypothetical protein
LPRVKDLLLYVMMAVVLYVAVWVFAGRVVAEGGSAEVPLKWIGFAAITAMVFGYTINVRRESWRSGRYWLLLTAFLTVHCCIGAAVLVRIDNVPLLLLALLGGVENHVLALYLALFMRSPKGPESSRS